MLDIIFFILFILSIIIVFAIIESVDTDNVRAFFAIVLFLQIASLFTIIYLYANSDYKTIETKCVAKTVNGIGVTEFNGDLINLNKEFGRQFEDGQEITILTPDPNARYLGFIKYFDNMHKKWCK